MSILRTALAAAALAAAATVAAAATPPPPNDAIGGAITMIPVEHGFFGSLDGATADTGFTAAIGNDPVLVWYRFTMPVDGTVVLDTAGSQANNLGLLVIPDPSAGGNAADATFQPDPASSSDTITVASFDATKGSKFIVGVGTATAPTSKFSFRLNLHFINASVQNRLVTSPAGGFSFGISTFDTEGVAFTGLPRLINASTTTQTIAVDSPFGAGEATFEVTPTTLLPLGIAAVKATSVGHGPFFGRAGSFRRAVTARLGSGPEVGRRLLPIMTVRTGGSASPKLKYSLNQRSAIGTIGQPYTIRLTVTNTTNAPIRGCFPVSALLIAAGATQDFGSGMSGGDFQAVDTATGSPLASANIAVTIQPKKAVTYVIKQRIASLGLNFGFRFLFCADPVVQSTGIAFADFLSYGYTRKLKDAFVSPKRAADDTLVIPPNGSAEAVFSVHNTGTVRTLTILPTGKVVGLGSSIGSTPPPVSQQICPANAAGVCVGAYVTSLNTKFQPDELKRFRVRYTGQGTAADFPTFVYALDHGDPVGSAVISAAVPNTP